MNLIFVSLLLLGLMENGFCMPGDDTKKHEGKRVHFPSMYYSLDLSLGLSRNICVSEKKEIDGDVYRDITIKPGVIVNEVYNGDMEIWKAKPNRDLMKLIVIQKKNNFTYVIITKDRTDKLAETHIVVTSVMLTFSPNKDSDISSLVYSSDPVEPKPKHLRTYDNLTDTQDVKEPRELKELKTPSHSKEHITDLLPSFITKTKLKELEDKEEENKSKTEDSNLKIEVIAESKL